MGCSVNQINGKPTNVSETQKGYVPLDERFDAVKNREIKGDIDFFILANQQTIKELATLDLIFKVPPDILRRRRGFPGLCKEGGAGTIP